MMLADKRYGLSVNLISTKVLPLLIPQMVNPQLQYEHFIVVHEVLQEMFDVIDRYRVCKMRDKDQVTLDHTISKIMARTSVLCPWSRRCLLYICANASLNVSEVV
jgi:hypothetical protein